MNVNNLIIGDSFVTLLRVFLGCISKETTADGLLYPGGVLATRDNIQFMTEKEFAFHLNLVYIQQKECATLEGAFKKGSEVEIYSIFFI